MHIESKYKHAIRILKLIASRMGTKPRVVAAACLKDLEEDYPKWLDSLSSNTTASEMEKLVDGMGRES